MVPNLLNRTHEVQGDQVLYRFGNGLAVKSETFKSKNPLRVLPLGIPQGTLLNYMLNHPEIVRNMEVFEPFAGSGVLGLMAIKAGARYAEFLDINPRAVEFQTDNASLNCFKPEQFKCHEGDIRTFSPERKFDLLFANPPFVPTPDAIKWIIHSNGGADGNTLVQVLLEHLESFLKPTGEALIYVFQLVHEGKPLVSDLSAEILHLRKVEITVAQDKPIDFDLYAQTYVEIFPDFGDEIALWKHNLATCFGTELGLSHYVVRIGPQTDQPTSVAMKDNFIQEFGDDFLLRFDPKELAYGRIWENVIKQDSN